MLWTLPFLAAAASAIGDPGAPPARGEPVLAGAATPIGETLCERRGADLLRCPGVAGIDAYLQGPAGRRTVSFGEPVPAYRPLPFDATLFSTVGWRLDADGGPLAGIVSYRSAAAGTVRLVVRLPRGTERPGCLVAVIAGRDPAAAERVADRDGSRFRCGVDPVRVEGDAPPAVAAMLREFAAQSGARPPTDP